MKSVSLLPCLVLSVAAFQRVKVIKQPLTIHYYDFLKKTGEKKEVGRLWKNLLFPGIYRDYEDTKDVIPTVVVKTGATEKTPSRGKEAFKNFKQGVYNVADEKAIPQYVSTSALVDKKLKPVAKPAGFVPPAPKMALAIGKGTSVLPVVSARVKKPIIIYEHESDEGCKKVREACSMLDLLVEFRPCPGARFGHSDSMATVSLGRRDVPYMIDDNPSMYRPRLFGAQDIVQHLFDSYGGGVENIPKSLANVPKKAGGSNGTRLKKNARPDNTRMKPLTLYGWEGASPVKPVRQALNDLGLAHIMVNCAAGSANRSKLTARTKGVFQVPYIVDPNTGVEMFESKEIVKYLEQVYTV